MKHLLLLLLFTGICARSFAQTEIPFPFTSDDDNRMINETDSGKYFVASGDTANIVFINDETMAYKLLTHDHKILCEGSLIEDQDKYLQEDKWTEYYDNGKIKCTGYYHKGNPIGLWQHFYENGKPRRTYNYSIISANGNQYYCMSGVYKEYYENGRLKINGFYSADMNGKSADSIYVTDPITGDNKLVISHSSKPKSEKFGKWEYYNENGDLDKKEDN